MPTNADLAKLLDLVPADGSTIGNGALREELGWNENRYDAVKEAMVADGTLINSSSG